jgi:dTDP-4-amino-4,6-dideoxy-D-galactose acyltransferase
VSQTTFELSQDLELAADLLRGREEDGYNPPRPRKTPEAQLRQDLRLLANSGTFTTIIRSSREVLGCVCWRHLAWDSSQLGMAAARLDLLVSAGSFEEAIERKSAMLATVAEECRAHGVRYLTARVDAADLSTIRALERERFELLDGLLTFSIKLREAVSRPVNTDLEIRLYRPQDLEEVLAIARSAYTCDRFHVDRALAPGVADRLYDAWVRSSCSGQAADAVMVATRQGKLLSYVTCKIGRDSDAGAGAPTGTIGLVATAEEARGSGVGSATLDGAFGWFRQQGVEVVEVGTQMQNVGACRLYEQAGFRMARMNLTFRRLL